MIHLAMTKTPNITKELAQKLIEEQFPEFIGLSVTEVDKQGHDNRTYHLGDNMLIRMPTKESYALSVSKGQELLPLLAPYLTISIPIPLRIGNPSNDFPFPFSIYQRLEGRSIDFFTLDNDNLEQLALDLSSFLKELHNIDPSFGPHPGQHNWWRGDHVGVYDSGIRKQIANLIGVIDTDKVMKLWDSACKTGWKEAPVWVHGDLAIGNILVKESKLSAIIDFDCMGIGDPACDLVIAWTVFKGKAQEIFIQEMNLDQDTWLRAKAWALWKSTFEICQIEDKNSNDAFKQKGIITEVLSN